MIQKLRVHVLCIHLYLYTFICTYIADIEMNYRLPRASKQTANELLNYNDAVYPAGDVSEDSSIDEQYSSSEDEDSPHSGGNLDSATQPESATCTPSTSRRHYRWRKRGNAKFPCTFVTQAFNNDDEEEAINSGPYAQFKSYVTDDLFAYISDQTNMYSVAKSGVSINTTPDEIERLFAIWLYSGLFPAPSYRDYWSPETCLSCIADLMPVNRYEKLMQNIHMCDNNLMRKRGETGYDPLFKIRRFYDTIRNKCRSEQQTEFQSIDEQIVPFKGRHIRKQYLPSKPHRWGFKMITRGSSSGIIFDFILYAGSETELISPRNEFSTVGNAVRSLCLTIPPGTENVKLFMDNFYMTLELVLHLKDVLKIQTTGTMRSNRLHDCPLESEKNLKTRGRGSYDEYTDMNSNVTMIRWLDNRVVTLASTYLDSVPMDTVKRWDSKTKKHIEVRRPHAIAMYNAHMGGIDLNDMLQSMYQNQRKSRKWYIRILYYLTWIAITNSWLIYRTYLSESKYTRSRRLFILQKYVRMQPGRTFCKVQDEGKSQFF